MRAFLLLTAIAALWAASGAAAQTINIHAGRVIDPASGRVLTDQRIRIVGGKFAAMTPWRSGDGPTAVDWAAYTVLPGLIDLHTHLADGYGESSDPAEPLKHSEAATILKGAAAALTELRAGFTTVRDVGVYRGLTDVALRVAGGYITTPGGGGEVNALAPDVPVPEAFRLGEVHDATEARDRARYFLDHGADFIKLIATGAVLAIGSEPGALELSPEEMKAACDEAKLRGSYCIAHAHGAEGIRAAIRAGARTIEHASYLDAEGIERVELRAPLGPHQPVVDRRDRPHHGGGRVVGRVEVRRRAGIHGGDLRIAERLRTGTAGASGQGERPNNRQPTLPMKVH